MAADIDRQRKFPRNVEQPVGQPVRDLAEQEVELGKSGRGTVAVRADHAAVENIHLIGHCRQYGAHSGQGQCGPA